MAHRQGRRLKLGILANELFSTKVGRMGGFGWAVQQVSRCFADDPELGVDVVILMGEKPRANAFVPRKLHGSRVLWPNKSKLLRATKLRAERLDLILSIDYRPNYRFFFYFLPRVPIVIWVRDPWDSQDRSEVATLRIPGQDSERPAGVEGFATCSLRQVSRLSNLMRRPLLFATTAQFLAAKIPDAYGLDPEMIHSLPNIIHPVGAISKASRPTVVYLARLDPTKRPWVFAALAECFPHVEFIVMGQNHIPGPCSWEFRNLPANLRLLGHVNETKKRELLSAAWLLISPSIHEGLCVSFLEALACETPLIACSDPEGIVTRFGIFVGKYPGTGLEALPALKSALHELLNDTGRRLGLGAEGRVWVNAAHSRTKFLKALSNLCVLAGTDLQAYHRLTAHQN